MGVSTATITLVGIVLVVLVILYMTVYLLTLLVSGGDRVEGGASCDCHGNHPVGPAAPHD